MSEKATHSVAKRLASERGASFSIALLIILVCIAISSIVLAASTAAAGRFAEQGKIDQNYYSVISAARMFQDSIEAENEITFVQERSGKRDARTSGAAATWNDSNVSNWSSKQVVEASVSGSESGAIKKGYSFLPDLTSYYMFGDKWSTVSSGTYSFDSAYAEPFSKLTPNAEGYAEFTLSVKPVAGSTALDGNVVDVTVTGRMNSDHLLEFDFTNAAAEEGEKFHLYMSLAADISDEKFISEELGETTEEGSAYSNKITVTEDLTTTVSWHIQQIVPGRGF